MSPPAKWCGSQQGLKSYGLQLEVLSTVEKPDRVSAYTSRLELRLWGGDFDTWDSSSTWLSSLSQTGILLFKEEVWKCFFTQIKIDYQRYNYSYLTILQPTTHISSIIFTSGGEWGQYLGASWDDKMIRFFSLSLSLSREQSSHFRVMSNVDMDSLY